MNVTLCSAFRNASGYLDHYFVQVVALANALDERGDSLSLIMAHGDSTDDTDAMLPSHMVGIKGVVLSRLIEVSHGGQDYGSIVHPERFANLAKVWNAIWERIPTDADAVLFVESDLIWGPSTILALLDDLAHVPAVAPMVMLRREGFAANHFYDVWAARKDGRHIGLTPPYFPGWDMAKPIRVDSMGSVMAIRGDLARQLTWPTEDVIVGLSRIIYELGGSIWLDPKATVYHS